MEYFLPTYIVVLFFSFDIHVCFCINVLMTIVAMYSSTNKGIFIVVNNCVVVHNVCYFKKFCPNLLCYCIIYGRVLYTVGCKVYLKLNQRV